jgi:hypothetical protein
MLTRLLNFLLKPFQKKIVHARYGMLIYQHDYGRDGYDRYRDVQVYHNKRKIDSVWADSATLSFIADYLLRANGRPKSGLCHGTRNGFEQQEFSRLLGCDVYGTEISDSADQFPNTLQWDFHEPKPEWVNHFSFVYSNSLDQAFDPKRALATWVEQLDPDGGLLFIEHTMSHAAEEASEMDPFGAHPFVMPYLFFEWGRGKFELADILHPAHRKANNQLQVWIFVLRKARTVEAETARLVDERIPEAAPCYPRQPRHGRDLSY